MGDDENRIDDRHLAVALKTLVEELPFDVWVRDAEDNMIFANAALRRRWPGVMGRTVDTAAITSSVAETWRTTNARALAGEAVKDEVVYDLDGGNHTVIGVVTGVRDADGRARGTVGINVDVTGERRARAEAHRLGQLASLGTLSASIGHEIGTSAAVALGHLEIVMKLVERGGPTAELVAGLREAQRSLLRAVAVLRDMRALAMGATLGSESCDVGATLDAMKSVLGRELEGDVTLHERRLDGVEVAISQSRLLQILLNLVRNAVDAFAGSRGTIEIEVSAPSPDRIRIDVLDDGPGPSPELRERLFEPFLSTKSEGTGLGLYVCNLLVTAARGTIQALPREGGRRGLRMRVELPFAS